MSTKITPQDYIDALPALGRAGFMAVCNMLAEDNPKTISEVATLYGIDERIVELVKTTTSYAEFETIVRLEKERQALDEDKKALETKLETVEKSKSQPVQYSKKVLTIAGLVFLAVIVGVIWGFVQLVIWIVGLF